MAAIVTLQEADQFFSERLFTDAWEDANNVTRQKALSHAESQIKALTFHARGIPSGNLKKAICAQALYLLQSSPSDRERIRAQRTGVKFRWVGDAREDYTGVTQQICPEALEFLKGYVHRKMGGIR